MAQAKARLIIGYEIVHTKGTVEIIFKPNSTNWE